MRITEECRRVIKLAVDEARQRGDREWGREHVLLALSALSDEPDIRGAKVLGRLGVDERRVRAALDRQRPPGPEIDETPLEAGGPPHQQTFAAHEMERVYVHTHWLAAHFGHRTADTEHLLLGVLADDRPEDRVLRDLGVRFEDVYQALTGTLPAEEITPWRPVVIPIEDFNSALRMLPKVLPAGVTYNYNFDDEHAWFETDWDVDLADYIKLALARA